MNDLLALTLVELTQAIGTRKASPVELMVVENWFEELKRLAPTWEMQ